jgi:ceramide glucosyltransferase
MLVAVSLALYYLTLGATLAGIAYYLIVVVSIRRLRRTRVLERSPVSLPPMSLLKPLHGADPGLETYLDGFFTQDYPAFEIIFAVRQESDPAVAIVRRLMAHHHSVPARLVVTGEPRYANAKVYSMEKMAAVARHAILVITDSDTSVGRNYLRSLAASFELEGVGAVTNLYRGIGGKDLWSQLEALGMSTEFMAGVVVAERLEGMNFTLGPSMAVRAECLEKIGGFGAMADYLADDFVLGQRVASAGWRVSLSTYVIDHHATAMGAVKSFQHRLRWNRSSRFSRPAGYFGQGVTYLLPWALALLAISPTRTSLVILLCALITRAGVAILLTTQLLGQPRPFERFWLIPLQDLLSFAAWAGGFMGREVIWRNERYLLLDGGRFSLLTARRSA